MGKGDKKTKKGKRFMGSYGVSRKRKSNRTIFKSKRKPSVKKKEEQDKVEVEELTGITKKEPAKKTKAKAKAQPKAKAKKAAVKKTPAKKKATASTSDGKKTAKKK